jgi:hypothetical protein
MQVISPKRYTREQVSNDVLAFASLEAALNKATVEFIDYDIETNEWLIVFRTFEHDDA